MVWFGVSSWGRTILIILLSFVFSGRPARTRTKTESYAVPCLNDCSSGLDNHTVTPARRRGVCVNGECQGFRGYSGLDCSIGKGDDRVLKRSVRLDAIAQLLSEDMATPILDYKILS